MIRHAHNNDLQTISLIHKRCFPESYSSQLMKFHFLGGNLQVKFFEQYLNDCPELFFVAEINGNIVGYCMGYFMDNDKQMYNFVKENYWNLIFKSLLLLISGNKPTWKKIISRFDKNSREKWMIVDPSNEHISINERGDLLSICILPEYMGKGFSKELMDQFLKSMKKQGKKLCLLSVLSNNKRAIAFYEKNGFVLYRTRGETGRTYMKLL